MFPKLSSSCLGPHTLFPNAGGPILVNAGCRVIKSVNNMGVLLEAITISPEILAIGRFDDPRLTAEELRNDRHLSPSDAAEVWVNTYRFKWSLNPHVKYIELVNEPVFKKDNTDDIEGLTWLNDFCMACALIMGRMGLRAVGPNFSTGYPDLTSWVVMMPFLKALKANGGLLGIHGYSVVPPVQNGFETFRHEMIYDRVLKPNGLKDLPIVYTEWGRIEYKRFVDDPTYARELIEADNRLMKFEGKVLATIFTFGTDNQSWNDYETGNSGNPIPNILADYMRSVSIPVDPVPPVIEPPFPPSTKFVIGDRIRVTADIGLRVRSTPQIVISNILGVQLFSALGKITEGPVRANGINWWRIDYVGGNDGWSSEIYLDKAIDPIPDPIPSPKETLVFVETFDSGYYTPIPLKDNMRVPNGWLFWNADADTPRIEGQDESQFWIDPEMIIRDANSLHISEVLKMLGNNTNLYHVFRGWGRLWIKLWRKFTLTRNRYRIEFEFFVDVLLAQKIIDNVITKTPDPNPINNEFKFITGTTEREFTLGDKHPSGEYTTMSLIIDHLGGDINLGGEFRARWGDQVVGWFLRSFKVYKIG